MSYRHDELVGLLYDAALDPTLWRAVGEQLMQRFDAATHQVSVLHAATGRLDLLTAAGISDEAMAVYAAYFAPLDLWVTGARHYPAGQALLGPQLVSDTELERSELYNDFNKIYVPDAPFRIVGALVAIDLGITAVLGFHRPRNRPDFTAEDASALNALMPHLERALQLSYRLGNAEARSRASLEALNNLSVGILLLDRAGSVVFVNSAAEAIIKQEDGLSIARGRLIAGHRQENARLQLLIGDATRQLALTSGGGAVAVPRASMRSPFRLVVAPVNCRELGTNHHGDAAAIVFVSDSDRQPQRQVQILAALFRLHPAEARLVMRLLDGLSPREAADALGVSVNTVRSQLKSIFAKTGCSRQSDLIRIVLSSPAFQVNPKQ